MPFGHADDTAARASVAVDIVCWLTAAVAGAVVVTQTFGWTGARLLAIVHSLTPYFAVPMVMAIGVSVWRRRLALATVGVAVAFGIAVLGTPLAFPDGQPPPRAGSVGLDVASVNLWYQNERVDEIPEMLAEVDADVIVFSEYTPDHQETLVSSSLAAQYPHRVERNGERPTGMAVWSRWPLGDSAVLATYHSSHDVVVTGPDGDLRLVAMHMATPFDSLDGWQDDLTIARTIGETTDQPTLLIGDLNSSFWHPDYRRVLDAGFVDAHSAAGSGFSTSWPTNRLIPTFVRLDHALTTGGLVSTAVSDLDVPGSDHRGLVVTVAPAR